MVKTRYMAKSESEASRSWYRLPSEIRHIILHIVLADTEAYKYGSNSSSSAAIAYYDISFLATVCLEWKVFFERSTFKQLILNNSDLPVFQETIERSPSRLAYTHYILLFIQLTEYNCDDCTKKEDQHTINRNKEIFSSSIRNLLKVLSLWKPQKRRYVEQLSQGLTLEIAIASPSDNEHMFFTRRLDQNYPFRTEDNLNNITTPIPTMREARKSKSIHRTRQHVRGRWHLFAGAPRLYGTPLTLRPVLPALPKAPIVTALFLPQYTYRSIEVMSLAQILRQSLVALKSLRFVRNRALMHHTEERFIHDFTRTLIPSLPSSLERLHMGQRFTASHHLPSERVSIEEEKVAEAIVSSQIGRTKLSRFSTGSQVSATAFLERLQSGLFESGDDQTATLSTIPRYRWNHLQQLCLKSRTFSSSDIGEIERVLHLAAGAMPNLPKLQMMEICGTYSKVASRLFQYKIEQSQPMITWTCSKKQYLSLSPCVVAHWTKAINHIHPQLPPLNIIEKTFTESEKEIRISRGQFIYKHLALRRLVFDAVTFAQIQVDIADAMQLRQLHYQKGTY